MVNKKIQDLLDVFDREDDDNLGMVVFDINNGDVMGTTFDEDYVQKTIKIEQMILDLEKDRIMKLDKCGPKVWAMYSFDKKIVATARIRENIFLSCEYVIQKSPSSAIEDLLEVALMINWKLD